MADKSAIEWMEVPGFPCYAVTDRGQIRGPRRVLRPMRAESGHLYVIAHGHKLFVHRAVLSAFVGPCPDGQESRHIDGEPTNNDVGNLCWGTRLQNMRDKERHGRIARGDDKPGTKLTAATITVIRADGRASRVVAAEYGVSHTTIQGIRRGRLWGSV